MKKKLRLMKPEEDAELVREAERILATNPATREEQHGRYLDCGPNAWDDVPGDPE